MSLRSFGEPHMGSNIGSFSKYQKTHSATKPILIQSFPALLLNSCVTTEQITW